MTVEQIAKRLYELCQTGDFMTAQNELYAADAKSIEPEGAPDREAQGTAALTAKKIAFQGIIASVESIKLSDITIMGNSLVFSLDVDFTAKDGSKQKLAELCVYTVKDGKIILEQFFM